MITLGVILLSVCFLSVITGGSFYFYHTRTQVEETKRMEMQETTKRRAIDNAWLEHQNEQERLQLERQHRELGKGTVK